MVTTSLSSLSDRLEFHADNAPGRSGAAVINLTTGENSFVNPDQAFGTSSTIKLGILYALMRRIDQDPNVSYLTTLNVGNQYGTNQGNTLIANQNYRLTYLAETMIADSNNWATNRLINFLGRNQINQEFSNLGLNVTRINRYMTGTGSPSMQGTTGPGGDYRAGFDNLSTPREMVRLLQLVHNNNGLLSNVARSAFWRIMGLDGNRGVNTKGYTNDLYQGAVYPDPDNDFLSPDWANLLEFQNKAGSNTWSGQPGDFAAKPGLGNHFQRSEAGRITMDNGQIVFYAAFVDDASDGDQAIDTIQSMGYEIAAEYANPRVTFTPSISQLDDGRVVTVRGRGASVGDDIIDLDDVSGDRIAIYVNNDFIVQLAESQIDGVRILPGGGNDNVYGSSLNDSIFGGLGNDTLRGEGGNDAIWGEAGNDQLLGGIGNDTLRGGSGNDRLRGDSGNDVIRGDSGTDTVQESGNVNFTLTNNQLVGRGTDTLVSIESAFLTGGSGNNTINASAFTRGLVWLSGAAGNDYLRGGSRNDLLGGGTGHDRLQGNNGNDALYGGSGNDTLHGGRGNDTLNGGGGLDTVQEIRNGNVTLTNTQLIGNGIDQLVSIERAILTGGTSNNIINAQNFSGAATLDGRAGNDTLRGGSSGDRLYGSSGNDTILGYNGNDFISGGAGNDLLFGGNNNDSMQGDSGNDTLNGGAGNDMLTGGIGWDQINGGSGSDRLLEVRDVRYFTLTNTQLTTLAIPANPDPSDLAIPEVDTLFSIEAATLIGGNSDNLLDASAFTAGGVILYGLAGDDTLRGGSNGDTLNGGDGDDTLNGGAGNDWLIGGMGRDELTGGEGSDRFRFDTANEGIDRILDFNVAEDIIQLAASGFPGLNPGTLTAEQFTVGSAASASTHRIGYSSETGALWFDPDGTGIQRARQFATLTPDLNLSHNQFVAI